MMEPSKTPDGVLVRLKNKIALAMQINAQTLRLLIDSYYTAMYGKGYAKSHNDKVNALGDFTRDKMTIKVFFKFLRVIKAKKITITMTITTARDKEVTVSDDIYINVQEDKENEYDND